MARKLSIYLTNFYIVFMACEMHAVLQHVQCISMGTQEPYNCCSETFFVMSLLFRVCQI